MFCGAITTLRRRTPASGCCSGLALASPPKRCSAIGAARCARAIIAIMGQTDSGAGKIDAGSGTHDNRLSGSDEELGQRAITREMPEYEAVRRAAVWNGRKPNRYPAMIVAPETTDDVRRAV